MLSLGNGSEMTRQPLTVVAARTLATTRAHLALGADLLGAALPTAGAATWAMRHPRRRVG